jgi:hypothetical protein
MGWPTVLDAYPLAQGAAWEYQVVIDRLGSDTAAERWEGPVTETVVSATPAIENWVFHRTLTGDPSPTWRLADQWVVARGSGLYTFSDEKQAMEATNPQTPDPAVNQILTWPLQDGQRFGLPDQLANEDGRNIWVVTAVDKFDVPAGHYEGCFKITMLAELADVRSWFCPGVGFVRYEYHNNGTLQEEFWELTSFTPGS